MSTCTHYGDCPYTKMECPEDYPHASCIHHKDKVTKPTLASELAELLFQDMMTIGAGDSKIRANLADQIEKYIGGAR